MPPGTSAPRLLLTSTVALACARAPGSGSGCSAVLLVPEAQRDERCRRRAPGPGATSQQWCQQPRAKALASQHLGAITHSD